MKAITVPCKNERMFIKAYLALFNGLLKLTNSELRVLEEIVWEFYKAKKEGQKQPYISQYVFSPTMRQTIRERLSTSKEMSEYSLNNFFKGLRDKRVLIVKEDYTDIDAKLYPDTTLTFNYKIDE